MVNTEVKRASMGTNDSTIPMNGIIKMWGGDIMATTGVRGGLPKSLRAGWLNSRNGVTAQC